MSFLTLEDINTILLQYKNRPFWNQTLISTTDNTDFTNKYYNYLKVSRTKDSNDYIFTIQVDNDLRTGNYYFLNSNNEYISNALYDDGIITVTSTTKDITVYCELWVSSTTQTSFNNVEWIIESYNPKKVWNGGTYNIEYTLKPVNPNFTCNGKTFKILTNNATCTDNKISLNYTFSENIQFYVTYDTVRYDTPIITNKKVNVVAKPNPLIIGQTNTFTLTSQSSNLSVESDYPVSNTGKNVTLDLTSKTDLKPINLTIHTLDDNDYVAGTQTYTIQCIYQQISNATDLTTLFANGGYGELTDNIILNSTISILENVHLNGNDHYIIGQGSFATPLIIINTNKKFTAKDTQFGIGNPIILQKNGSTLDLTNCLLGQGGLYGDNMLGTSIKCDLDLDSLNDPNDYTTILTDCLINESNGCCILHGGNLTLDNTTINGQVTVSEYPYSLYQVDGDANINNCNFTYTSNTTSEEDLLFNPAIFCVGETATIDNSGYSDYGKNDIPGFLNNNTSTIDVTYHYDLIDDDITLESDNGYCHMVSGVDYLFKTNVTPRRTN